MKNIRNFFSITFYEYKFKNAIEGASVVKMESITTCWATLPIDMDALSNVSLSDLVQNVLREWWLSAGCSDENTVPLAHVAFIDSLITSSIYAECQTSRIPVTLEHITRKQGVDLSEQVYVVFYAIVVKERIVQVLGAYPSEFLKRYLSHGCDDPLLVCDLFLTPAYLYKDALQRNGVNMGTMSKSMWFHLELYAPDVETSSGLRIGMDHVAYRARLMDVFWKQRSNPSFLTGDGCQMLKMLHGPYFDLCTKKGRTRERAAYWTMLFACAHEPSLWEAHLYFERVLLEFRIQIYFCKERHFSWLIEKNELTGTPVPVSDKGKEEEYDDGETRDSVNNGIIRDIQTNNTISLRDKKLYRSRHPDGPLPTIWLAVPLSTAGSAIASSPFYDIDRGHVYITHRDFSGWVWHQMDTVASLVSKHIYMARRSATTIGDGESGSNVPHLLDVVLYHSLKSLSELERDTREKRKASLPEGSFDIGTYEGIVALAMKRMPLCQARHVFYALEREQHPKNTARVSFVKFLLDAGYKVDEVNRCMFMLYAADKKYIKSDHGGKWDDATYMREFGKQVNTMYKSVVIEQSISPYGCMSLVQAGKEGSTHGCPYARSNGTNEARLLLQWINAPAPVVDIEDVLRPSQFPQELCCRDFKYRRQDVAPIIVKHPNQFFRGGSSGGKRVKVEIKTE